MDHVDGKVNVKVKLLDITVILGIPGISTTDTVNMRLTPEQIQEMVKLKIWHRNTDTGESFDPALKREMSDLNREILATHFP